MIAPSAFTPTPTQPAIEWLARHEDGIPHAFATTGPAWHFSVCRRVRFTAGLREPVEGAERCGDCALIVQGEENEKRAAWGDR